MVAPDRLDFLAKDPSWTWIGWSLSAASRERVAGEAGVDPGSTSLTLRVHDLSQGGPAGPPCFDVEILGDTDHWYLPLAPGGHTYVARIGFKAPGGVFHAIVGSLPLKLPPAGPAEPGGEEWRRLPDLPRLAGDRPAVPGGEKGYLLIVLNGHLPFVRHPEVEHAREEEWLFEAIVECYVPLLRMISRLAEDGLRSGLTLSLSPTLLEMLMDPLLQSRARRYAGDRARSIEHESPGSSRLDRLLRDRFEGSARLLAERGRPGLVSWFRELMDAGALEVIASAASHAYLPLWESHPEAVELQVKVGAAHYRQTFGRPARGFWLPECGFAPGVDELLAGVGVRYFFLDSHGILNGRPRPKRGVHAPVHCPAGVAAFGRDWHSHDLVWRKEVGYPGDPAYLDADRRASRPESYDPDLALRRCDAHAAHFVAACQRRVEELYAAHGTRPVLVALFDAEHFGHWWHEGPEWLNRTLRRLAEQTTVRLLSAAEYLEMQPTHQVVTPAASSWGYQGYSETWLMGRNHWIYPTLFQALDTLREIASGPAETAAASLPLLDQAIRELLLAQSSDWAFILHQETAAAYATGRVTEHVENLRRLAAGALSGDLDPGWPGWLDSVRSKNNLFSSLGLWDIYRGIVRSRR